MEENSSLEVGGTPGAETRMMSPEFQSVLNQMDTIWQANGPEASLSPEQKYALDMKALDVLKNHFENNDKGLDEAVDLVKHSTAKDPGEGFTFGAIAVMDLLRKSKQNTREQPSQVDIVSGSGDTDNEAMVPGGPQAETAIPDQQAGSRFAGWGGLSRGQQKEALRRHREALERIPKKRTSGPRALLSESSDTKPDEEKNTPNVSNPGIKRVKPPERDEPYSTRMARWGNVSGTMSNDNTQEVIDRRTLPINMSNDNSEHPYRTILTPAGNGLGSEAVSPTESAQQNEVISPGAPRPVEEITAVFNGDDKVVDLVEERVKRNIGSWGKKAAAAVIVAGAAGTLLSGVVKAPDAEASNSYPPSFATAPSEEVLTTPEQKADVMERLKKLEESGHTFVEGESFSGVTFPDGEADPLFRTFYENTEHAAALALANLQLLLENNPGMTREALLDTIRKSLSGDEVATNDVTHMLDHVQSGQLGVILPRDELDEWSKDLIQALNEGKFTEEQKVSDAETPTTQESDGVGSLYTVQTPGEEQHTRAATQNVSDAVIATPPDTSTTNDTSSGSMPPGSDIAGAGAAAAGATVSRMGLFSRIGQNFKKSISGKV